MNKPTTVGYWVKFTVKYKIKIDSTDYSTVICLKNLE